jgi:hypothetical protein
MPMTLVVMAAGRGSRFGGMKQVAGLGPSGESLFDYAVYDALNAGFDDVVIVVSEESEAPVAEHVDAGCGRHVTVKYVRQSTDGREKPWGTGHAVLCGCQEVSGPFGVVNADDFYGARSFALLGEGLAADSDDHLLIAFRLRESLSPNGGVSRGICRVDDGLLTSIAERHDIAAVGDEIHCREGDLLTGDELISANLWGFRPSFCSILRAEFDRFRQESGDDPKAEFLVGEAVASLRDASGPGVRVVPTPERFSGVTYAEDVSAMRAHLASLVDAGNYPSPLWP